MSHRIPREGEIPSHLTFLIGKAKRKLIVPMKKDGITIGRNSTKTRVDVDMNPFDGLEMGVSREHLLIQAKKDYFIVKDLESVNSSWHNKIRMKPMVAEELYHGDLLHLGELRVEVYFTYEDEVQDLHSTKAFADTSQHTAALEEPHTKLADTKQFGTSQQRETRRFDED